MYTPTPFNEAALPAEDGHTIYYAEYGNAEGPVIVSVHGGPGSQSKAKHAAVFDLTQYRVVLFDQRGCGKSQPVGSLQDNTTSKTVDDMERLRSALGVTCWFVAGSSWGATIALVYAQRHPDNVAGLLLSAIFLVDEQTDQWAFGGSGGALAMFPDGADEWRRHLALLGLEDLPPDTLVERLYTLITTGSAAEQAEVAALLHNWEANLLSRNIPVHYVTAADMTTDDISSAALFLHYRYHKYFLTAQEILQGTDALASVPVVIVHGRCDILCPPDGAARLNASLPHATLVWLPETHHVFAGDGAVARSYVFAAFLAQQARETA
jgi:proline iminopeptidase